MNATPNPVLLILLLFASVASAQDIILNKKGGEEKVQILGLHNGKIEFKKYRQPSFDKRVFFFTTNKALAIRYENGVLTNSAGEPITTEKFDYLKYNARSHKDFKRGIPALCFAGTFAIAGISLMSYGLNARRELSKNPEWNKHNADYLIINGAVLIFPSIPLGVVGSFLTARGIKYRKKADALKPALSFNPLISPGIGAAISTTSFTAGLTVTMVF